MKDYFKPHFNVVFFYIYIYEVDDGFEIKKDVSLITRMFDLRITRRSPTGLSFDIMTYKDHIRQLFDIFQRRGIQLFQGLIYIDNSQKPLKDITSLLADVDSRADFRGKTFEEMWDGLGFVIYCTSENDNITNLTMTFCEK